MQPLDSGGSGAWAGNDRVLPVRPGDKVAATGRAVSNGQPPRLHAVGRDHYDRVFHVAGGLSVPIDIVLPPDGDHIVTVEGTWTGEGIGDARIVQPVEPVGSPEHLGTRIDTAIVPNERRAREELLAQPVLEAVDRLRGDGLLFYVVTD